MSYWLLPLLAPAFGSVEETLILGAELAEGLDVLCKGQ